MGFYLDPSIQITYILLTSEGLLLGSCGESIEEEKLRFSLHYCCMLGAPLNEGFRGVGSDPGLSHFLLSAGLGG